MTWPAVNRRWFWAAIALTAGKLWLTSAQTIYAIGPALHDDELFVKLAAHLLAGHWLGPYDQFTLAKGPMFPLFIAASFWIGLPLMLTQQLLYAGACAVVTQSLAPWLRRAGARFALYALLLANPMSYDAGNLSRLMRQNLYTPLALLVVAGLVLLFTRRREPLRRLAGPALLAGGALGGFWLTREESVWLLPAVGLLLAGPALSLGRELRGQARALAAAAGLFLAAALLPVLVVCTLNWRHYGWFGTVEFRAAEFKAAYGALTRLRAGPDLPQVPVTRQMREVAYSISPTFARLRPALEGAVGDHWIERNLFPAADRQIRGGWMVWALRDAMVAAGLAPDAATALRNYQRIADEVNAACASGRVPARPPRTGFLPPLDRSAVGPLLHGAVDYGAFFLFFQGFTAYSPDSVGDYAELKPFRDLVGTHLSHAPRTPDPLPPSQAGLADLQLRWLEVLGRRTGAVLAWFGPLLLLVGLVRLVQATLARRWPFLLGLAGALLAACGAYLAINVLVHVTSFYNMSPAAMASAYPLYLLGLFAIGADAVAAWSRSATPAVRPPAPVTVRLAWLLPAGAALFVFGARLREIHLFGSAVPRLDQWYVEGKQIIAPWLDGTLRPWDFFRPYLEHVPVWSRLLVWLEVALTGRWDPLVQMTVNAILYATFVWLVVRWVVRHLSLPAAGFVLAVVAGGGALPHAWENIAWGFPSQYPLALLCLFLHVHGVCQHPPGSRRWWLGQAAGLAGLFTVAGMWLAPLALAVSFLWTARGDRRNLLVPGAIAGLGVLLLVVVRFGSPALPAFAALNAAPLDLLHSALQLLGWPGEITGAVAVIQLPWLALALRLRGQRDVGSFDRMILVLGLWNLAQALGLAFARAGDPSDSVSRQGELLFAGVLAGALALARLVPATREGRRRFAVAGAILWCGVVGSGLVYHATEGQAQYFHQTAGEANRRRLDAVQAFLARGDRRLLDAPETQWVLTGNSDLVVDLLTRPAFRAVLPAAVNPANADTSWAAANRGLQARWAWLASAGLVLLAAGAGWGRQQGGLPAAGPALPAPSDPWPRRLALGVAVLGAGGLFVWSNPLAFNQEFRWRQVLGGDQALTGLGFHFATPSPFGPERLQGAAPIAPESLRNQFFGTAPEGPGFTGTVLGSNFVLQKPWLVVPYSGYPVGNGNGLRVQILDNSGTNMVRELGCDGPNLEGIGFWLVHVAAYTGRTARLVLYDGRTDTEAWVAAAAPVPTDNPALAATLAARLRAERHAGLHASLAAIAAIAFACWLLTRPGRDGPAVPATA